MATSPNVLYSGPETFSRSLFGRPSSGSYRAAIAAVIRNIKASHKLSNERLAEIIGVSEQTIANAEGEKADNDLKAVTLLNIAYAFGEEAIAPVRNLYLCAPPEEPTASALLEAIERNTNILRRLMEDSK